MVSFSACQLIWLKNNAIGGKEVWLKAVAIVYEVLKFEKKRVSLLRFIIICPESNTLFIQYLGSISRASSKQICIKVGNK